jgi:hypothetical protein
MLVASKFLVHACVTLRLLPQGRCSRGTERAYRPRKRETILEIETKLANTSKESRAVINACTG